LKSVFQRPATVPTPDGDPQKTQQFIDRPTVPPYIGTVGR